MRPINRERFTAGWAVCAAVACVPGLIFAYSLNGWVNVVIFGAGVLASSLIAAQLLYRKTSETILAVRTPWAECLVALAVAYVLFGFFAAFTIILTTGGVELGWEMLGAGLQLGVLSLAMAIILTIWLALPAVLILAFRLRRSSEAR